MSIGKLETHEARIQDQVISFIEVKPTVNKEKSLSLLILHGWNQKGTESWEEVIKEIACRHPSYRIIALDLPGMGQSQPPKSVWNAMNYADFIAEFLTSLNVSEITILGHSFGGAIGAVIAGDRPDMCTKLVLLAPAIIRPPLSKKQKIIQSVTNTGKNVLTKVGLQGVTDATKKLWYRVVGSSDYVKTQGIMKEIMAGVVREDLTHVLTKIKCETTVVWGDKDLYTPIWQLDIIRRNLDKSNIYMLEGINHGIHLHARKSLYSILDGVLN